MTLTSLMGCLVASILRSRYCGWTGWLCLWAVEYVGDELRGFGRVDLRWLEFGWLVCKDVDDLAGELFSNFGVRILIGSFRVPAF